MVAAAKKLKAKGYPVSAVTCRASSSMAQMSDITIAVNEADEESIVMTRSFTSMFITMVYAAEQLAGAVTIDRQIAETAAHTIERCEEKISAFIQNNPIETFVFLGSGMLYGFANEAMLKMKEMTLSNSEAFHPFEYRHGPKSLVSKDVFVTLFASHEACHEELQLMKEIKELHGKAMVIAASGNNRTNLHAELDFEVSHLTNEQAGLIGLVIVQLMGCYLAEQKGLNIDSPRNLTQVVKL